MKALLICVALGLTSTAATAKCLMPVYEVTGLVATETGEPAAGISVGVAWVERGYARGPVLAQTDAAGRYTVRFRFNTYTKGSWLRGDLCQGRLERVSVGVAAPEGPLVVNACVGSAYVVEVPGLRFGASQWGGLDPSACGS